MYNILYLILPTLSVEYFDQLLGAAHQVHVVYLAQLLGAVLFIHFISNHDNRTILFVGFKSRVHLKSECIFGCSIRSKNHFTVASTFKPDSIRLLNSITRQWIKLICTLVVSYDVFPFFFCPYFY